MALAADRSTVRMGETPFPLSPISYKQKGSTTIYKGSIVALNAGYAAPGASAASLICVGMAVEKSANAGADGAVEVKVEEGIFKFKNHGTNTVVAANVGSIAYIEDDETVGNLATSKSAAGKIVRLDSDGVWVKMGLSI